MGIDGHTFPNERKRFCLVASNADHSDWLIVKL